MNTKGSLWVLVTNTQLQFRFQIISDSLFNYLYFYFIYNYLGFPGNSNGKESACNAGYLGLIPVSERSPGGGHGNPLQYSCLESPIDRGAWWVAVHGLTQSWTWLSKWHFHFHFLQISTQLEVGKWWQMLGGFTIWIWIFDMDSENWRYLFLKIINNLI